MKRKTIHGFAWLARAGWAALNLAAAFSLLLLPRVAHGYGSFSFTTGSHDFTGTSGYGGASVCSECHTAGGGAIGDGTRLLVPFTSNIVNGTTNQPEYPCSKTCHIQNATSPTINPPASSGGGWASTSTAQSYIFAQPVIGASPPHSVACTGGKFLACEECHPRTDFSRCLDCHSGAAVSARFCDGDSQDTDSGRDLGVSKFFAGMSGAAAFGVTSPHQGHTITYSTNPTADMTLASNNECLKCHGVDAATAHPGRASNSSSPMSPLLVFPDVKVGQNLKTIVPPLPTDTNVTTWNTFNRDKREWFCLSCHDGVADNGVAASAIQLGGSNVPAVPRYNYNSGAPSYASGTPYFANVGEVDFANKNYYISNGHGAPTSSRTGTAMSLTCMGETNARPGDSSNDTAPGCHSSHGAKNYSVLRDSGAFRDPFITGVTTPEKMSQFCQTCHNRTTFDSGPMRNGFHAGLMNTGQLSHFDSRNSLSADTFNNGNTVFWRSMTVNMQTGNPGGSDVQPMPFFTGKSDDLATGRLHSNSGGPGGDRRGFDAAFGDGVTSSGSVITCVTCHDPHGTFNSMEERVTDNTFGMLRFPEGLTGDSYTWELCGQCHVKSP